MPRDREEVVRARCSRTYEVVRRAARASAAYLQSHAGGELRESPPPADRLWQRRRLPVQLKLTAPGQIYDRLQLLAHSKSRVAFPVFAEARGKRIRLDEESH